MCAASCRIAPNNLATVCVHTSHGGLGGQADRRAHLADRRVTAALSTPAGVGDAIALLKPRNAESLTGCDDDEALATCCAARTCALACTELPSCMATMAAGCGGAGGKPCKLLLV